MPHAVWHRSAAARALSPWQASAELYLHRGHSNTQRKLTKLIKWTIDLSNSMNYEPCRVGLLKMEGSWWRVLTKHGPLEKGMANHFSILALRTPWTVWKDKKIEHWKMNFPGWQVPNKLLEKNREIAPEGMKRLSQSGNIVQLWICLVVKVKSIAVKKNTA